MKSLIKAFTDHPGDAGNTYWEHMRGAISVAYELEKLVWALCVHAAFPFLFTNTASQKLLELGSRLGDDDAIDNS